VGALRRSSVRCQYNEKPDTTKLIAACALFPWATSLKHR
jgi:hypothetical protein